MSIGAKEQEQPPYFGKYQWYVSVIYFEILALIFFSTIGHIFYATITYNYAVIVFYAVVIFLQSKVKRSQKYVDFVNNVMQARQAVPFAQVIHQETIDDKEKCLFGIHPHGVFSTTVLAFMNYKEGPFSRMVGMCSRFMLSMPFIGLILRLWGVQAVDPNNMKRLMREGENIGLIPGGFQEATLTVTDQVRVFIKERKGFVKYALEHNYTIYPVLSANQHRFYWTFRYFLKFRLWFNKFKIPGVLFINPKTLFLMPWDIPYIALIGKGIKGRHYEDGEKASQEEIDQIHANYIEEIKRIHEKHIDLIKSPLKLY